MADSTKSMHRQKNYNGGKLSVQGWRLLVALIEKTFGTSPDRVTGTVHKDSGRWGYSTFEEFLVDVVPGASNIWVYFQGSVSINVHDAFGPLSWDLNDSTRAQIVSFEREADLLIQQNWVKDPDTSKAELKPPVLFIGHGRSRDWRDLKDHLQDKHQIRVEAYETGSRAGHSIRDILEEMLEHSNLALLVHTPEDEMADGSFTSRPNVIHETGLFQGRLGFSRAVILRKHGTAEFSNLSGIQEFRYMSTISETFGDVLAWIKRETQVPKSIFRE